MMMNINSESERDDNGKIIKLARAIKLSPTRSLAWKEAS